MVPQIHSFFYEKPRVEAFNGTFKELDKGDAPLNVKVRPIYFQKAVDMDPFRVIHRKILPAKGQDIAGVVATVLSGNQLDTELCSMRRQKIF